MKRQSITIGRVHKLWANKELDYPNLFHFCAPSTGAADVVISKNQTYDFCLKLHFI